MVQVARVAAMAVAVVARLPVAAMAQALAEATVVVDLAEAPAPRTRVSRARIPVTDSHRASHVKPMHRASAMHKHRENTVNNSAKTHVARA